VATREADVAPRTAAVEAREAACARTEAELRARSENTRRREQELEVLATSLDAAEHRVAEREAGVTERAAVLDGREASLRAKEALVRQRENEIAERTKKLEAHEAKLTQCAASLQARDTALEERDVRLREQEAAVARRTDELVVAFAAVEERKREQENALDERAAATAARLESWEAQLACTEALLAEREVEVRRSADQLRVAAAELEDKKRAAAVPQPTLTEPAGPAMAGEHESVGDMRALDASRSSASEGWTLDSHGATESSKPFHELPNELGVDLVLDADVPPAVDVSDFSPEEVAQFKTRRRLGLRNDAAIAAEIRSERVTTPKKKGWWF